MRLALLLLLLPAAAWGYTATITPSCTVCNINDTLTFTVAITPSITTTYDVTAYVAEFVPPTITVLRDATVSWRFIDNAPYNHLVHVEDDGGAWLTMNLTHNSVATYTFASPGFYTYRLQPPIEGAPSSTTGNITIEQRPVLNITPPSSPFFLELNGSGTSYTTSYLLSDPGPTGIWVINLSYTDSKNNSARSSTSVTVTRNLQINVSSLPQVQQEQNIAIPMNVRRASGALLSPGESANITCTDVTQGQANTTASSGPSATCYLSNLTVFGTHTVNVTASFSNNYASVLAYYNVTYYYSANLGLDSPAGKYNLGTTANLTANVTPVTGSSGTGNFTVQEPGGLSFTYPVSGTGSFTQTHTFGTTEGTANISFSFTDAQGRRAYQRTSVVLTRNLTVNAVFPYLRQENNLTANVTVTDTNGMGLAGAIVSYTDLNETMNCNLPTDTTGAVSCTFSNVKNFGWHTVFITATRGSNYGNLTTRYLVDGYYPTAIIFKRGGNQITSINLKEFFDISVNPADPSTGVFIDGLNLTGALTNTINCVPTYSPMAGEYFWRACDGGSSTGQQTVNFKSTAADGHVAYATRNITVSSRYTLSAYPPAAEFVSGQTSVITVTVTDVNGYSVSGANVTCKEGTNTLTTTYTTASGSAICSFSLPTGTRNINITASRDYNGGSILQTYTFSTTGSTTGPSTVAIAPYVVFSEYPATINLTAGTNATAVFTILNKGTEKSPYNRIKIGAINQNWYTSPTVEVAAGEKKNLLVDFRVPADAQPAEYNSTATVVGTLCVSKIVYPNGTYFYTGGDCESKPFSLTILSEIQAAAAQTLENISITNEKQEELSKLIEELKKLGISTAQAESSLETGKSQIADAKKLLNSANASAAAGLVEEASLNYDTAITKARADLKGAIDPLISAVESKLSSLQTINASKRGIVDNATSLLAEARKDYAAGSYSDAKAKLDSAYALIRDLQPKAPPKKAEEEKGFSIPYTEIGILAVVLVVLAFVATQRGVLKERLEVFTESIKGKRQVISKYVWPEKLSSREEGVLTISLGVKNASPSPMKNVEIIDLIPLGFSAIDGSFNTGAATIPMEVGKTLQGKAFRWRLAELQPGKSVNITYKASVVPIGDQLRLPPATVKYTDDKGRETKQASANPSVEIV